MLLYPTNRAITFSQAFPGVLDPVRPGFPVLSTQVGMRVPINAVLALSKGQHLTVRGSIQTKTEHGWAHSRAKGMNEGSSRLGILSIHSFLDLDFPRQLQMSGVQRLSENCSQFWCLNFWLGTGEKERRGHDLGVSV